MGRPALIDNPDIRQRILDTLNAGLPLAAACQAANVGQSTVLNWLARGRRPDAPDTYREFMEAVERARTRGEAANLAVIRRAATGWDTQRTTTVTRTEVVDGVEVVVERKETVVSERRFEWTAAAWLLERMYPDRYGRRTRLDVDVAEPAGVDEAPARDRAAERLTSIADRLGAPTVVPSAN